jgi:hypothetical protein
MKHNFLRKLKLLKLKDKNMIFKRYRFPAEIIMVSIYLYMTLKDGYRKVEGLMNLYGAKSRPYNNSKMGTKIRKIACFQFQKKASINRR